METAKAISDLRLDIRDFKFIFRAGAWKPRTSPNSFQGAGNEGLKWLQDVRERFGIAVATEVMTAEQMEKAIDAGIDYVWIGARSSANPMAIQGIADSIGNLRFKIGDLKGIFVKNPSNEDAGLWLGNIERLEKAVYGTGCKMAHEVRLARPDIPMLLDPSHMSGDASKVPELMNKVEELGLDGAMIEVHCDPEHALSDKKQQITPYCLRNTLDSIASRMRVVSVFSTTESPEELYWLRAEIDELDERLWDTIAARMDVSRRIGAWKKSNNVEALQPKRYQQKMSQIEEFAKKNGIDEEMAQKLFEIIHSESVKVQE